MRTLIATVGLPRSGKSTWARAAAFVNRAPIVNPDSIRLALYGEAYIRSMEPYVWAITMTTVEALFMSDHEYVIVDATNINRKSRDKWQSDKWNTEFYLVDAAAGTCVERAKETGREDLIPVINRMLEQFEPLGEDENIYKWEDA